MTNPNPTNDPVLDGDVLEKLADDVLFQVKAEAVAAAGEIQVAAAPAAGQFTPEAADAIAGPLLRGIRGLALGLSSLEKSRDAEVAFIRGAYEGRMASLSKRLAYLTAAVEALAARTVYPGKSKSRATAHGRYGVKLTRAKLEILDVAKVLEAVKGAKLVGVVSKELSVAAEDVPAVWELVSGTVAEALVTVTEKIDTKALLPLLKLEGATVVVDGTGEVVEGVKLTPAKDSAYVKLEGLGSGGDHADD